MPNQYFLEPRAVKERYWVSLFRMLGKHQHWPLESIPAEGTCDRQGDGAEFVLQRLCMHPVPR